MTASTAQFDGVHNNSSANSALHQLTPEEVALYDRQLRVWGVDAQHRIRNARVIMAGAGVMRGGLAAEVAKNLVLAGVGEICMLVDHDNATPKPEELAGNFLMREQDFVETAEMQKSEQDARLVSLMIPRLQELNPLASIAAENGTIVSRPDEYFSKFDAIVLVDASLQDQLHAASAIRRIMSRKISLFACGLHGFYGYMWEDLQRHSYFSTKISRQETDDGKIEEVTQQVFKTLEMKPLAEQLSTRWSQLKNIFPRRDKLHPLFAAFLTVLRFYSMQQQEEEFHIDKLRQFYEQQCLQNGVSENFVPFETVEHIAQFRGVQISPIAAVLGGIVGQEILQIISQKENPLGTVLYDAVNSRVIGQMFD